MPDPNYLAVLQALAQLPQPARPSLITPPTFPTMEPPESVRFPMPEPPPPAPTRSSGEFLPEILARVRGVMGPGTPPYVPPTQAQTPVNFGTIIQHLLRNLPQAIAVGASPDPGGALQQQLQQQTLLSERRRQEEEARREKIEDRRYGEDQFIRRTALGEAQQQADRAQQQQQAAADRQFALEVKKWERELGLKDDREKAMLQDLLATKRQRAADEAEERRLEATTKKQIALQMDDRIKAYRDQGANDAHATELARNDFRMALEQVGEKVAPLSAGAEKANRLIQAKIARLQAGGGGRGGSGGGGAGGRVQSWIEFTDGNIVEADKVNFDRMPGNVQVRRMFSTIGGQPIGAAGAGPQQGAPAPPPTGTPSSTLVGPPAPTTPVSDAEIKEWRAKGISEAFIKGEIARRGRVATKDKPSIPIQAGNWRF